MITALDHIAIAVPDLEQAITRFLNDFGLNCTGQEYVASQHTATAFFPLPATQIELVAAPTGEGPIARYVEKNGGGLHHLCFRSDDIDADVAHLKTRGYQFLSDAPGPGAHGCRVIFIHPKYCGGVLIELSQPGADSD